VIGAIIKQVQAVIADPKSQELLESLKRERSLQAPTTHDRINQRHQAEKVLGPDENVFRIDWLSESKAMTIQLIGKDDGNVDDTEVLTNRWQAYVDAYVSVCGQSFLSPIRSD
jgi:paired amphipathic helix protein Sin3a